MDVSQNSLIDSEQVLQKDVPFLVEHEECAIIRTPTILVHVDEMNGVDRTIKNLRLIKKTDLRDLMAIALQIGGANKYDQIDICSEFIKRLSIDCDSEEMAPIMQFLEFSAKVGKDLDVDEDYIDTTTPCNVANDDVIRFYVNDPYDGMLLSSDPKPFAFDHVFGGNCSIQLFSQLPIEGRDVYIKLIREAYNDTDLNRFHRQMQAFEKTLAFDPKYFYSRTVQVTNLALFYMCLYTVSRPIEDKCSYDVRGNMLSFVIDLVIRSRTIQAWQKNDTKQSLLTNMIRAHNPNLRIIEFCKLKTSRERSQHFIKLLNKKLLNKELLRKNPELAQCISHLDYDSYMDILKDFVKEVHGNLYYVFDSTFITEMAVRLPNMDKIQTLYQQSL